MKKNLIIGLLSVIIVALASVGFNSVAPKAKQKVYCKIKVSQKGFSNKMDIIPDFGEAKEFFKDPRLRDEESGKIKAFNSDVDALNYMASEGWKFADLYFDNSGGYKAVVYLMEMEVDTE